MISGFWMLNRYCCGVPDAPVDDVIDVDDVFVAGQYQALLRPVADPAGGATAARAGAEPYLDDVLARHLGQAHLLDRIGQPEVQARRLAANRLAEAHNDAKFVGIDAERERKESDDGGQHHDDHECQRARAGQTGTSGHDLLELVLATLKQLFEIGLMLRSAGWTPGPFIAASRHHIALRTRARERPSRLTPERSATGRGTQGLAVLSP